MIAVLLVWAQGLSPLRKYIFNPCYTNPCIPTSCYYLLLVDAGSRPSVIVK
jgi:hypothetical protein